MTLTCETALYVSMCFVTMFHPTTIEHLPFVLSKPHPVMNDNSILAEMIAANVERCREKVLINL